MIDWLAAGSGDDSPWWIAFAVPTGVISAALLAGLFSMRTWRKTPHEKLEKLIGVLKDWPDDLPGRETVHQAIQLALGDIRDADKLVDLPPVPSWSGPEAAAAAEKKVDAIVQARQYRLWQFDFAIFMLVLGIGLALLMAFTGAPVPLTILSMLEWVGLVLFITYDPGGLLRRLQQQVRRRRRTTP